MTNEITPKLLDELCEALALQLIAEGMPLPLPQAKAAARRMVATETIVFSEVEDEQALKPAAVPATPWCGFRRRRW
jgi:hypothetical protein